MDYIFWIFWTGEMLAALFWIGSEMKLQYLKPNPYAFLSFFYLLAALVIRYNIESGKLSVLMVIIPGVPLLMMLFIVLVHTLTGGKWN
ncbi:MAG: hypothetical protein QM791_13110 [Ferruginibacter sp.]